MQYPASCNRSTNLNTSAAVVGIISGAPAPAESPVGDSLESKYDILPEFHAQLLGVYHPSYKYATGFSIDGADIPAQDDAEDDGGGGVVQMTRQPSRDPQIQSGQLASGVPIVTAMPIYAHSKDKDQFKIPLASLTKVEAMLGIEENRFQIGDSIETNISLLTFLRWTDEAIDSKTLSRVSCTYYCDFML